MDEEKKFPVSFRIPAQLNEIFKERAKKRNISVTDLFIDALEFYLGDELPGLCFKCKSDNPPETKFCLTCGALLSEQRRIAKKAAEKSHSLVNRVKDLEKEIKDISKILDFIAKQYPDQEDLDYWRSKRKM